MFVPIPCSDPRRVSRRVASEYLFTEIELLTVHFDFLVEVDVDRAVIRTLYRRLDVAVFYPWEETFGDEDIINLRRSAS